MLAWNPNAPGGPERQATPGRLPATGGVQSTLPLLATLLLLLLSSALSSLFAGAQTALASIQGRLLDSSSAVVAGASVTVRNTDLGTTRVLTSSASGSFRADGLVPGSYTVEARGSGLAMKHPLRLTLSLGSSQEVQLRLDPAGVAQSARTTGRTGTVEGNTTAPAPNTTEASLSTFLPGLTVTYLPNRDRNFAQFTSLTAGAQEDADGTGVNLNGERADDLLTELDGTSFSSPLFGGQRGAKDRTLFLPLTAVREFEIVRTGADVATGRSTAGLVNVVTKGGANRPRGEAFYSSRPSHFTSADAFGRSLNAVANNFGGSYGGPLRRDHAFYFGSLEKDFLQTPFYAAFDPQAPGTIVPDSLTWQQGQIYERHSPLAGFGRMDFNLNPGSTLTLELGLNRIRTTNLGDGLSRSAATAAHAAALSGQSVTSRAGLTSALTSRLFNNAVVAWSSDHRHLTPNSTAPEQVINGLGILGGDGAGDHLYTAQRTQVLDDLTLSHGRDALTFGANLVIEPSYEQKERNTNGRFDYTSLTDFLNNQPRRFQQTFVTGDVRYQATVKQLGLYGNARVALRPTLFLTAGVRWDGQWNPQLSGPASLPTASHVPNDLRQWQPRLGLAWSPGSRTVVRLATGLYAAPTPATFFHRVFADSGAQTLTADSYFDPQLLLLAGGGTPNPHALDAAPAGLKTPDAEVIGISPDFRNPVSSQVSGSVERQLLPKLDLTLGYVRNSTWGLERRLDENLSPPTVNSQGTPVFLLARPLTGVGRLLIEQSTAHSTYDGGSLSVNAPISRRSQLLLNYTLARTRDDDSSTSPYSPAIALNPFAPEAERAYANQDVRHSLNLNAIFNLPAGFKLNPLLTTRSGVPYTPIVGFDRQNDANDLNDRAMLATLAAPRNSLRQPAFTNLDLRFVKDFTLKGEGHHLDLFLDVFNLAGTANRRFAPDALDLFGDAAHPVFSAGQPLFAPGVSRFGGPRSIQLTARLVGF